MSQSHVVILGQGFTGGTIKIEDKNTGGSLTIKHGLSQAWVDNMSDDTLDPLVELANDLNDALEKGNVSFTLIGNDNLVTFNDDNFPIFEGGIMLKNTQINQPYLKNCKLFDVDLQKSLNVTIHYSKVDQLFMECLEPIHMVSCYVNDRFGLELVRNKPYRFLMNKTVAE